MMAACQLDEPQTVTEYKLQIDRRALGTKFKSEQKKVKKSRSWGMAVSFCRSRVECYAALDWGWAMFPIHSLPHRGAWCDVIRCRCVVLIVKSKSIHWHV